MVLIELSRIEMEVTSSNRQAIIQY